ncbi:DUF885 domain-containing protein [Micropruina sonneratiae]|uniref:DUF885 domain-containing protein n=1 Tax=Micropruina sonneratiae TaxID=2986940 RepID=UPI0022263559|nr:DUF885 domain-containing protein [Micropruina sp. KQZ13P-5]MCW3159110.1 DUF885 domain-containing protein [Micropruina sp. KQZ13P-5]
MTTREPSEVDALADAYTLARAELDPLFGTAIGLSGYDHLMSAADPDFHDADDALARDTLAKLDAVTPRDETDRVTVAAMRERLGLLHELHEAGEQFRALNNIASPLQGFRDVFDVMPNRTEEHWSNIASRLAGVPQAVDGYLACLREGVRRGYVPPALQVREGIVQADQLADPENSFFTTFHRTAEHGGALALELDRAGVAAAQAYGTLAAFLRDLEPQAPAADASGRDRYRLWSRLFLGAEVDLDETYEWGLDELARVTAEQDAVVETIAGTGATVADAVAVLDADEARKLRGTDALREWMQSTADEAVAELNGVHFDIPEPVRTIECMIAPTQNGGIYYTGPSDDFTRPGRMWWSVPPGVTEFNTWREKTTVYHEGVPGHHLQIGQAVHNRDQLNLWRRLVCWVSGHGEGWALYAERLMQEFGYMDDPGDLLGLLDGQRMRATRVVLDIGVHLGKPAPQRWGGGTWDAEKAWELLRANVNMDEKFLRFELNRYLGWPGQAPSYKIGQRLWQELRAEAEAKAGASFSLRDFHSRALNLGSLPLSVLRDAVLAD